MMADVESAQPPEVENAPKNPEVPSRTPHDLVKKKDVEIALKKEIGSEAVLTSFTIEDFTTKGDNYACVVSSVLVKYKLQDKELETSYVVKLNPCRSVQFDPFSKMMFEKEIGFYSQILPLLNAELEYINAGPLLLPKYFHSNGTTSEEVIYLEDLRRSGFKMFDRKKGIDKAHTELLLKELARLHAASTLFMNKGDLLGKDIKERYPILEEAFNALNDDSAMKLADFLGGALVTGAGIIEGIEGYEHVVAYLRSKKDECKKILDSQLTVTDQFRVICHGDCWNNNCLFRYSADGKVEECRLLDLQINRVGSPALDLNYMLYCSLDGNVRRENMDFFFKTYYASFASTMAGAGVAMKFTLPQLREEFYKKNPFGLLMGVMVLPMVLMNSEDAPNMEDYIGDDMEAKLKEFQEKMTEIYRTNPLLRPRFLAMFDDMIESGAIVKVLEVPSRTPHDLIKKKDVEIALKKEIGSEAVLTSFTIEDFTTKGDNYACVVSSVLVKYKLQDKELETSYVVKLNPCRSANFDPFSKVMFEKEIGFYSQLLPLLNAELDRINVRPLLLPKYFHSNGTTFEEVIYLEDLRRSGFKMFDRQKGMDQAHTELLLEELARLHAASTLFMNKGDLLGKDIAKRYPILEEAFDALEAEGSAGKMADFIGGALETGAGIIEEIEGYEQVVTYLRSNKEESKKLFDSQLTVTGQFRVICHGDCWNNNFLFRYSADGKVEECRLLDLQITRVGSLALDLNYMLYCSLTGDVRNENMDSFFTSYYASFASTMAGAGVAMKFTLPQLKEEFHKKKTFGLLMGVMLIPMVLMDSEDAPNMEDFIGEDMETKMREFQEKMSEIYRKNPLLRPRYLALLDDMIESGVIC